MLGGNVNNIQNIALTDFKTQWIPPSLASVLQRVAITFITHGTFWEWGVNHTFLGKPVHVIAL